MDDSTFARLTLRLSQLVSRRGTVMGLGVSGLAVAQGWVSLDVAARKKRRRKKKRKRKIERNDFGCVAVGGFCQQSEHCCSGICVGNKGKKTCRAHDASTCQGQNFCLSDIEPCTTTDRGDGQCAITTGDASYCMTDAYCYACATDADCLPVCGAGAACIVCPKCGMSQLQTACAGLYDNACFLT